MLQALVHPHGHGDMRAGVWPGRCQRKSVRTKDFTRISYFSHHSGRAKALIVMYYVRISAQGIDFNRFEEDLYG